jgi:hypothetical protein
MLFSMRIAGSSSRYCELPSPQEGVQYVLIGGQAVRINGFVRSTEDSDILLLSSVEHGHKVIRALNFWPCEESMTCPVNMAVSTLGRGAWGMGRKIQTCSTAFRMFTMNRCLLVWLSAMLSTSVLAQGQISAPLPVNESVVQTGTPVMRKFPANALRGQMKVVQAPEILIDGKPERLSPGSRIRDIQQRIVLSASITNQVFVVNFVRNPLGEVQEVWLLNELEAKQKIKANTAERNFSFASESDTKKQDDGKTPFHQLQNFEQIGRQQRDQAPK